MDQRRQREYVYWRAPQMARSGHFRNWREIEAQLGHEDAPEARHVLRIEATRRWLDGLCIEARG